jgi:hypothetical protein
MEDGMSRMLEVLGIILGTMLLATGSAAADQSEPGVSDLCTLVTLEEATEATGLALFHSLQGDAHRMRIRR